MKSARASVILVLLALLLGLPAFPSREAPEPAPSSIPDLIPRGAGRGASPPPPGDPRRGPAEAPDPTAPARRGLPGASPAPDASPRERAPARPSPFLVEPHVQPGPSPREGDLLLLWETADRDEDWRVQVRTRLDEGWRPAVEARGRRVAMPGVEPWRSWSAPLAPLAEGTTAWYRVLRRGEIVFDSFVRTRRSALQATRFAVLGDTGSGTSGEKALAFQAWRQAPDALVFTGDLVRPGGRLSDYRGTFFPVFNAAEAGPERGAPLLRSVPAWTAVGENDTGGTGRLDARNLEEVPDGLAWFLVWALPLNGPATSGSEGRAPRLQGPPTGREAFMQAAGPACPRMSCYSLDSGNTHWTVLDSNDSMDWTRSHVRDWVRSDLARARGATWRFVVMHAAPFPSSPGPARGEAMRVMADLFEEGGVDVVFGGHVHAYERSRPIRFLPRAPHADHGRPVEGEIVVDRRFDGRSETRPRGIVYLVAGAGGGPLEAKGLDDKPSAWKTYTAAIVGRRPSFTLVDATDRSLVFRQVAEDGTELDRFVITR